MLTENYYICSLERVTTYCYWVLAWVNKRGQKRDLIEVLQDIVEETSNSR